MSPVDLSSKTLAIARGLLEKTRNGELEWIQSAKWPDLFLIETSTARIHVDSVDSDGFPPYRLRVRNLENNQVVAEVAMTGEPEGEEEIDANTLLDELYSVARESVLKEQATLDDVIRELGIEE